jgi:Putative plant transposon protein
MAPRVRGRGAGRQGNQEQAESSRAREMDPRALLTPPRRLLPPRYIDFNDISPYVPEFEAMFAAQGWTDFVSSYRRYYPQLVQQFYSNLVLENDRLYSMVKGVRISVNISTLANALSVDWEGMTPTHGAFDHVEVYSAMTERDPPNYDVDLVVLDATTFPPMQRLLHHVMTTIIYPKGGSRNEVNQTHKLLFHCLINGIPCSLPSVMLQLIELCRRQQNRLLPYASQLTALFSWWKWI